MNDSAYTKCNPLKDARVLPPYAFKDCKNLRRIVCNDLLDEICDHAFEGCEKLTEIIVGPNTITAIDLR